MKALKHKPVGEDLGNHGIRKHPTAVTPIQHSVVLERLYGIKAPPILVQRALGRSELNQNLLHLGNSDLLPGKMKKELGVPVTLSMPQAGVKLRTKIVGQFRFGKGSRKSKPFEKLFKSAPHKSVIIKEVVTGDQAEFIVLFY
jgi:hypothetical protein